MRAIVASGAHLKALAAEVEIATFASSAMIVGATFQQISSAAIAPGRQLTDRRRSRLYSQVVVADLNALAFGKLKDRLDYLHIFTL